MKSIWLEYWGQVLRLPLGETLVGRARRCRLRFSDPTVSRVHLRLTVTHEDITVEDLQSRGGSWVNGERLEQPRTLNAGDMVTVGTRDFTVCEQTETSSLTHELPVVRAPRLLDGVDSMADLISDRPTAPLGNQQVRRAAGRTPGLHYRPRNPTEPLPMDRERRRHERVPTNMAAIYVSDGLLLHGVVRDLSSHGLFIASDLLDRPGTTCQVDVMPEGQQTLTFHGIVRHVVDASAGRSGRPPGFGLEFTYVTDAAQAWLDGFLEQTKDEQPAES